MLAWLGLVLAAVAWLYVVELTVPPRLGLALALGILAAVCLLLDAVLRGRAVEDRTPWWQRLGVAFGLLIGVFAGQAVFHMSYERVAPYYRVAFLSAPLAALWSGLGVDAVATEDLHPEATRGLESGSVGSDPLVALQTLRNTTLLRPALERFGVYPLGQVLAGGLVLGLTLARRRWLVLPALLLLICAYAIVRMVLLGLLAAELALPAIFWNPWAVLASLLPLVPLLAAGLPRLSYGRTKVVPRPALLVSAGLLAAAGAAGATLCLYGEVQGARKPGRILINDLHSGFWEVTTGVFDEEALGERTIYTYTSLRDWLDEFYDVRVNTEAPISDALLADVDVFLLKTPLQPIRPDEQAAILRFVERGGGLWLHGDHTNLFGMSTFLNPTAAPFGFHFRHDDTFDLTSGQPSPYTAPWLGRHPAVGRVNHFMLQTTCTIAAPLHARPVLVGRRMGSEMVDYGHTNFFGNIKADPEDDFGLYLIAATRAYGAGRVLAFGDSTIFSNFTMFLPGIPEFALSSAEFLNYRAGARDGLVWAGWFGVLLGAVAIGFGVLARSRWIVTCLALGLLTGHVAAGVFVTSQARMVSPEPTPPDRTRWAVMDQVICSYRLPSSLEYEVFDSDRSYDAFYLNLVRLGLRPRLGPGIGPEALSAGVRIFLLPTRPPTDEQLRELRRFVEGGGRAIVFESSQYLAPATITLLKALDVQVSGGAGRVRVSGADAVRIDATVQPRVAHTLSVHRRDLGSGQVVFVAGAEWLNRRYMGQVYKTPDPLEREWYRMQFHIFHQLLDVTQESRNGSAPR